MDNELEHLRKEVERLQKALNDRQQVSVASPALIEISRVIPRESSVNSRSKRGGKSSLTRKLGRLSAAMTPSFRRLSSRRLAESDLGQQNASVPNSTS